MPPRTNMKSAVLAVAIVYLLAVVGVAQLLVDHSSSSDRDVKLSACTSDAKSNSTTATVLVTNHGTDPAQYDFSVEFDGYHRFNRVPILLQGMTILVVQPGETVQEDIPDFSSTGHFCSLKNVNRYKHLGKNF